MWSLLLSCCLLVVRNIAEYGRVKSLNIPLVVLYTAVGGLKATFLTDFLHTTIALILLIYFALAVLTHEKIGGVSGLYEKMLAADDHIAGNYMGSLLSFKSEPGEFAGHV